MLEEDVEGYNSINQTLPAELSFSSSLHKAGHKDSAYSSNEQEFPGEQSHGQPERISESHMVTGNVDVHNIDDNVVAGAVK